MSAFSPLYFVRENKMKCFLLSFMLFLGYVVYLGGIYITNPRDNWNYAFEQNEKRVFVYSKDIEKYEEEYSMFIQEIEKTGRVEVFSEGRSNYITWNSVMGFDMGAYTCTFVSVKDFERYCRCMGIECDMENVKDGSMIISELMAKNRDIHTGDVIGYDFGENIYGNYTVDAMTKEAGYTQYYINGSVEIKGESLIVGNGISGKELEELVDNIGGKYKVLRQNVLQDVELQFKMFDIIYIFVLMLVAVILAVTINSAFSGMYMRRNFEFAIYRAIGITKWQIVKKIAGEFIIMDVMALTAGGAIFFLVLYLLNNLVLYPVGKYLCYYNPVALAGMLICNVAVLFPLIVIRSRQAVKADICGY